MYTTVLLFLFEEISFILQECIKLIKRDSGDIYNVLSWKTLSHFTQKYELFNTNNHFSGNKS